MNGEPAQLRRDVVALLLTALGAGSTSASAAPQRCTITGPPVTIVHGAKDHQVKFHENWARAEWECLPGIWPRARCEGDRSGIDVWL